MFLLNNQSTDPFFNLASEEYLLQNNSSEYLILYVNSPCIVVGKHQVSNREADIEFITRNSIPLIRRISGGGTVFHDNGNLNFSFISNSKEGKQVDFRKYTLPVIKFLSVLGVEARFEGKNDLKINGLKISGNSEHIYRNRVLHHGTLLYDTNLDFLKRSIRKDTSPYKTRAVNSNPSHVANLKGLLTEVKNITDLRSKMKIFFIDENNYRQIDFSPLQKVEIESLANEKYRSWEWNYAYGPEYELKKSFIFAEQQHECLITVKHGIIMGCEIKGSEVMNSVSKKLIGCKHFPADVGSVLSKEIELKEQNMVFNFF
jgi:lipoate---protein ligase